MQLKFMSSASPSMCKALDSKLSATPSLLQQMMKLREKACAGYTAGGEQGLGSEWKERLRLRVQGFPWEICDRARLITSLL